MVTGHNCPPVRIPHSVARPDKNHRITHTLPTWKLNFRIGRRKPPDITPCHGVLNQGVYIRQSWNLAFRTPFPVTENDIVHCVLILQGLSWGFHLALPLTGGFWPRGFMSANRLTFYFALKLACSSGLMSQTSFNSLCIALSLFICTLPLISSIFCRVASSILASMSPREPSICTQTYH